MAKKTKYELDPNQLQIINDQFGKFVALSQLKKDVKTDEQFDVILKTVGDDLLKMLEARPHLSEIKANVKPSKARELEKRIAHLEAKEIEKVKNDLIRQKMTGAKG